MKCELQVTRVTETLKSTEKKSYWMLSLSEIKLNLNICISVLAHKAQNTVTSSDDQLGTQNFYAKPQGSKSFATTRSIPSNQCLVFQVGTTPPTHKKNKSTKDSEVPEPQNAFWWF